MAAPWAAVAKLLSCVGEYKGVWSHSRPRGFGLPCSWFFVRLCDFCAASGRVFDENKLFVSCFMLLWFFTPFGGIWAEMMFRDDLHTKAQLPEFTS